jgi:PAS domain S-box-containing protein
LPGAPYSVAGRLNPAKASSADADTKEDCRALNQMIQEIEPGACLDQQARIRLLIVDDNRAIHSDFRKVLAPQGAAATRVEAAEAALFGGGLDAAPSSRLCFEIDSAFQGQEALTLVQQSVAVSRHYSVAFVDVRMPPGWDGIETTARLWEVDPDLQIVVCTAYSDYSWDDMLSKLGHSDRVVVLKKPFDGIEVLQLASSLSTKRLLLAESKNRVAALQGMVEERTAELVREHQKLRDFIDNSPAGIFQTTQDGRFISANPALARILGYASPEELKSLMTDVGKKIYADPDRRKVFLSALQKDGQVRDFELEVTCKDGSRKWTSMTASATKVPDQAAPCIHGYLVDVSEHKRALHERNLMEAQLRQAQKLESVAGIAHEINTPVQYIGDNLRFVTESFTALNRLLAEHQKLLAAAMKGQISPELTTGVEAATCEADLPFLEKEIPKALQQSLEGVNRVAAIVNAMKEFSHPGVAEKVPVDLNKAIQTTITVARNEWKYVAELATDFDASLPHVPCYPGEFNQVILNLLVNAAHAIGDVVRRTPGSKGLITITTRHDKHWTEIRVADTGTGIPTAIRDRIFEPFFTTKEVGKGTGQGLAIARATIVRKLAGELTFESAEGKGTTFIIRLPIHPPQAPKPEA